MGTNDTVYLCSNNGRLYAIGPDGAQKWTFDTDNKVFSAPAIGTDGTIYVSSYTGRLFAINPDGTPKWAFYTGNRILVSPSVSSNNTVYVYTSSSDGKLYAIESNGSNFAKNPLSESRGEIKAANPAIQQRLFPQKNLNKNSVSVAYQFD